ncbi:hypothetical protein CDAR_554701 [Caerostris darwini]|uniref:Uncharacterized protein n=1 Tax=Caerostris darwini TaxID=1538125 RepID=A0AAV4N2T6_9ARAC|nr:hypothetical protein CDAR_554701 [Caerostris darwini]
MHFSVLILLTLPAAGLLGGIVRYPEQSLCPSDERCYNVTLCPGATERFMKGNPPTICGWIVTFLLSAAQVLQTLLRK